MPQFSHIAKHFPLVLVALLVLISFNTSATVIFYNDSIIYPDMVLFGNNVNLTFAESTYLSEIEVGEDYFCLDDLNTSIVCIGELKVNVSTYNSSTDVEGITSLRFNGTHSGSVHFTFTGNHTSAIYGVYDHTASNPILRDHNSDASGIIRFNIEFASTHDIEITFLRIHTLTVEEKGGGGYDRIKPEQIDRDAMVLLGILLIALFIGFIALVVFPDKK